MRGTWLVVVALCAGCFGRPRSLGDRAREVRAKLASLKLVAPAVVVPLPPVPVNLQLAGRLGSRPADRAVDPEPIDGSRAAGEPMPASGGPAPHGQTVYARFQGAGGKWLCEAHPDADACTRSCNARFELALKMGGGTSCGCTTEKRCDQMVDH